MYQLRPQPGTLLWSQAVPAMMQRNWLLPVLRIYRKILTQVSLLNIYQVSITLTVSCMCLICITCSAFTEDDSSDHCVSEKNTQEINDHSTGTTSETLDSSRDREEQRTTDGKSEFILQPQLLTVFCSYVRCVCIVC